MELRKRKITSVYPRIDQERRVMEFRKVEDLEALRPGYYSLLEPGIEAEAVLLEDIQVVVIPGIVFDYEGYRLGYGKGYYDRLLIGSKAIKVGLAFSFQRIADIPSESHDQRVDIVITEESVYKT